MKKRKKAKPMKKLKEIKNKDKKVLFYFIFFFILREKSKTTLAKEINICIRSKRKLYEDNLLVYKLTLFKTFHLL